MLPGGPETLARCADLVGADPVGCNLAATVVQRGDEHDRVIRVSIDGATAGLAVAWGPGYTLTRLHPGAAPAIAGALPGDARIRLDGEVADVAAVAGAWSERTGGGIETIELFRVYRLGTLATPDPPVSGSASAAGSDHQDLAARWAVAFGHETALDDGEDDAEAFAARRTQMGRAIDEGRLRVWRADGPVVCQLLVSPPCFGAVRIGAVYTPPDHRGQGFGSALTAAVAAVERSRPDVDVVMLNTQAANAGTNRLYRRLGFEAQYEMLLVWLDPGPT